MLKGRLGLETARIPQADRHGCLWLSRGHLSVSDGTLTFTTSGGPELIEGRYSIPFQMLSCVLLGPGSTVTHDALRLLARHGTGLVAVGDEGVRFYASMPFGPDNSKLARRQARLWGEVNGGRVTVVRRMYAWRLGEVLPDADLAVLRGIEGARAKATYKIMAERYGVPWGGRCYDRSRPDHGDLPNQAINHAATAVSAAAQLVVAVTGTIPQLGFVHEDSGISFALDIADLFRDTVTLPVAFSAARLVSRGEGGSIERVVRRLAGAMMRRERVIPKMIDRIKMLLGDDDGVGDNDGRRDP